jgi:hypothetical protein
MVELNQSASEHLIERERTSSVAIVATQIQMSGDSTLAHPRRLPLDCLERLAPASPQRGYAG